MKKFGKYEINPAPYLAIVANPHRKKRRAKFRKNPARRAKRPGLFVLKKPTKNPAPKKSARSRFKKKARNPLKIRHVIVEENPMKRASRKKSRSGKRRKNPMKRKASRKKARKVFRSIKRSRNPMKHKKRRGGKKRYNRNPMKRSRGGRRMKRYSRNPVGQTVRELFGQPMLIFAAGVVTAQVVNNTVLDRINSPMSGQRSFDLPFVDYTMLGNAATAGTFYTKNAWILAGYKLVLGGAIGYALRNQAPRFSQGYLTGTVAGAITEVLVQQNVITRNNQLVWGRGTSRMYRGAGLVPGVNSLLTGPAQGFMRFNNMPAQRGTGALVGPGTMRDLERQSEGAFRGAN